MTSFKHTVGVVAAGLIAFFAVFGATLLFPAGPGGAAASESSQSSSEQSGESETGSSEESESGPGSSEDDETEDPLAAIVGRWQAPQPANQDAFVEFTQEGLSFGSDGCNNIEGAWTLSNDGSFDITSGGAMTGIGCNNEPIPQMLWGAEGVVVQADTLELTDAEGETSTLLRTGESLSSLAGAWVAPGDQTRFTTVRFNEDGTWSGETGCQVVYGTWELQIPDDPDTGMFIGPPGRLVIGPEPDNAGSSPCVVPGETALTLPIDFNTTYYISLREDVVSIKAVDAPIETQFVKMHRAR